MDFDSDIDSSFSIKTIESKQNSDKSPRAAQASVNTQPPLTLRYQQSKPTRVKEVYLIDLSIRLSSEHLSDVSFKKNCVNSLISFINKLV